MKRSILLMSLFMLTSIMAHAIPARPGIWRTITLKDGTTVKAMLKGDETMNFYEDKEGNVYMSPTPTALSHSPHAKHSAKRQA